MKNSEEKYFGVIISPTYNIVDNILYYVMYWLYNVTYCNIWKHGNTSKRG